MATSAPELFTYIQLNLFFEVGTGKRPNQMLLILVDSGYLYSLNQSALKTVKPSQLILLVLATIGFSASYL